MKIGPNGLALVKAFEGCHRAVPNRSGYYQAYLDPVGVLTIGYGHTNHHDPKFDKYTVWTRGQCDAALVADLAIFEAHVSRLAKVSLTQNEFDALVSWAFNTGGPETATLWGVLNAGHKSRVGAQLLRWDKAKWRTLPGLTRRRKAEALLFDGKIDQALVLAGAKPAPPDVPKPGPVVAPDPKPIPKPIPEPVPAPKPARTFLQFLFDLFRWK